MKKMIIAALVLLFAQIGLSLALNLGTKNIGEGTPDTPFLTFSPDAVQSLAITSGEGRNVLLQKGKDGWIMPAHFSAPVDQNKVKVLLDKLSELKQGFVVATSAEAAKRFKVDAESFENHVVLKGAEQTLADFYIGTSPAFRQVHARRGDHNEIINIPLSSFELAPANDKWLDTSLATIKDEDLIGLNFADFKLKKADKGWQVEALQDGEKVNHEAVNALVNKAGGLIVQDVLDPAEVADLFNKPLFHFTAVRTDGREVEYLFAKGKEDFYVLKMSDRDFYLKMTALQVEALQKETHDKLVEAAEAAENLGESKEQE